MPLHNAGIQFKIFFGKESEVYWMLDFAKHLICETLLIMEDFRKLKYFPLSENHKKICISRLLIKEKDLSLAKKHNVKDFFVPNGRIDNL